MPVQTAIQHRRGTASSWTSTNPTLAAGEIGFETDTGKFKIGTGSATWNSLSYFNSGTTASPLTTKGDLWTYSTTNARLAVGTNEHRLVADSGQTTGLKYVADTTNYAIAAKGDLLVGTAADTVAALTVGSANQVLTVDSSTATGLKWATPSGSSPSFALINSGGTALTGSTTVTVSGISGKNQLYIVVDGASSANASSEIRLRLNTDTGNNYGYASVYHVAGTGSDSTQNLNANNYVLGIMSSSTSGTVTASILIDGTNGTGFKPISSVSSAAGSTSWSMATNGFYEGTSTISSISIVSSTGNLDAGTVYVYGA